MTPPIAAVLAEPAESEMIVPLQIDEEDLKAVAVEVPAPFCFGGPTCFGA